jgi:hypothetical protein
MNPLPKNIIRPVRYSDTSKVKGNQNVRLLNRPGARAKRLQLQTGQAGAMFLHLAQLLQRAQSLNT